MEWLWNPLYVFVSCFGLDLTQCSISFPMISNLLTNRNMALIYSISFVNKKQRIVHGQGASNISNTTVVFNFDVCRLSYPVSCTNCAYNKCAREIRWKQKFYTGRFLMQQREGKRVLKRRCEVGKMTTRLLPRNNLNAGISDLARHAFETSSKTFYAKILQKIVCASM